MDLRAHHKPTFDNISAEKRSRILDAATNEFAVKGFENGNIGTIAKKAGVSVGSLYKYFENKQDLFLTVVQHSISQMEELLNVLAVSDEDILIKVEKIIRTIQSSSRESAVLCKALQRNDGGKRSALCLSIRIRNGIYDVAHLPHRNCRGAEKRRRERGYRPGFRCVYA